MAHVRPMAAEKSATGSPVPEDLSVPLTAGKALLPAVVESDNYAVYQNAARSFVRPCTSPRPLKSFGGTTLRIYRSHSFSFPTTWRTSFRRFSNTASMARIAKPSRIPKTHQGALCSTRLAAKRTRSTTARKRNVVPR